MLLHGSKMLHESSRTTISTRRLEQFSLHFVVGCNRCKKNSAGFEIMRGRAKCPIRSRCLLFIQLYCAEIVCMLYIKHERSCIMTSPNKKKRVKKINRRASKYIFDEMYGAWRCGLTLPWAEFDISSEPKLNLREKREKKEKIHVT